MNLRIGILEMLKHISNQMADVKVFSFSFRVLVQALESLQRLEKTLISVQKSIDQAALLMKL